MLSGWGQEYDCNLAKGLSTNCFLQLHSSLCRHPFPIRVSSDFQLTCSIKQGCQVHGRKAVRRRVGTGFNETALENPNIRCTGE